MSVQSNNEARTCKHCCSGKGNKYYILWVCICRLRYPAWNAQTLDYHLRLAPLCTIFPHYLPMILGRKKVTEIKTCFSIFSTIFVWIIFYSKMNWTRYDKKRYLGLRVKYPLFLSEFNKTCLSQHIFKKYSNVKFHNNPSSGSRVVPYGRTDGHDEAISRFFLMFMGPCIVIIFYIPTRCTCHRVYFIWHLLYMFRVSLSPIFRSTKQL